MDPKCRLRPVHKLGVLALAALSLIAGCGGGNHAAGARHADVIPSLQLRLVTSSAEGTCTAPPLTADGPGTACGMEGTTTFELAAPLAVVTSSRAELIDDPTMGPVVVVTFDKPGAARLADATRQAVDRQLAVLLQGRVVTAPRVVEPITGGQLQLAADPTVTRQVAAALHASATTQSPEPDIGPSLSAAAAEQNAACAAVLQRVAPGTHLDGGVNQPLIAAHVARTLVAAGDRDGAKFWRRQPADERVYLCNFYPPTPSEPAALPSCPPGQIPVVDGSGMPRVFYVDRRANATEFKPAIPVPVPTETCAAG